MDRHKVYGDRFGPNDDNYDRNYDIHIPFITKEGKKYKLIPSITDADIEAWAIWKGEFNESYIKGREDGAKAMKNREIKHI